jgi:hypothetical protein
MLSNLGKGSWTGAPVLTLGVSICVVTIHVYIVKLGFLQFFPPTRPLHLLHRLTTTQTLGLR